MYLISAQRLLHAIKTVIQKNQQWRLLLQRHDQLVLETRLEHPLEEIGEVLRVFLECLPYLDVLAKLLIQHHHDRHDVRVRGSRCIVRPEVVFKVLAEFEDHYTSDGEAGSIDMVFWCYSGVANNTCASIYVSYLYQYTATRQINLSIYDFWLNNISTWIKHWWEQAKLQPF